MWVFHSIPLQDLSNPEDMRFRLLDYCYATQRSGDDSRVLTEPMPYDDLAEPFDSLFEQRVANHLLERGFTVIPKFEALGQLLDLVVVGATTRSAVECEGDRWEGPEAYRRELDRQRELQRCGWSIVRIRESDFTLDQDSALDPLWTGLAGLGIAPADGRTSDGDPDIAAAAPMANSQPYDLGPPAPPVDRVADVGIPDVGEILSETEKGGVELLADLPPDRLARNDAGSGRQSRVRLLPYNAYRGTVVPVGLARPSEIIDGLVEIVASEGPILGYRLHSVYVQSSEGLRVGHQIAKALNSAIYSAVRRGRLIQDNPLEEAGVRPSTFRLPGQPAVVIRQLGPRRFEHIPPAELAAVMHVAAEGTGWDDELIFRETLRGYGIQRMGSAIRSRLLAVLPLARALRDHQVGG